MSFYDLIKYILATLWVLLTFVLALSDLFEDNWFDVIVLTLFLFGGAYAIALIMEGVKPIKKGEIE